MINYLVDVLFVVINLAFAYWIIADQKKIKTDNSFKSKVLGIIIVVASLLLLKFYPDLRMYFLLTSISGAISFFTLAAIKSFSLVEANATKKYFFAIQSIITTATIFGGLYIKFGYAGNNELMQSIDNILFFIFLAIFLVMILSHKILLKK